MVPTTVSLHSLASIMSLNHEVLPIHLIIKSNQDTEEVSLKSCCLYKILPLVLVYVPSPQDIHIVCPCSIDSVCHKIP